MLTKFDTIKSCYIGPQISPEQFVREHFFLYLLKGNISGFDGRKKYLMRVGDYCIVRKNHLAKYNKQKIDGQFEKVVVVFDELFLDEFQKKHKIAVTPQDSSDAFIILKKEKRVPDFINSLFSYYQESGEIDNDFLDVKREELLLILLKSNPPLSDIFFDFGIPEKINLEEFMNRNYKFNISTERFAYLTGRSISAFKRDFKKIFNDTPGHWLIQKRLEEAYFLIERKGKKSSDIYMDLGFEDLSHFSFTFKKKFGLVPSEVKQR
ncbi:helix-turn-helix domain-containing protein [Pedobacter metabolipauper]|uniref:AraC-like DNA-binding protein n=1 Tax=Pedobacter metabolipauper TaxID=425513 RepID=A0A4R6SYA5_9SPHI|nr:AraC family transcriptional regulator [Pedobacter metabolipauper]TDQ10213.1 AraC-like DNA-binding protein [Pedobacter metabolipauper]